MQQKPQALEYLVDFCESVLLIFVVVIEFNFKTSVTTFLHICVFKYTIACLGRQINSRDLQLSNCWVD